MKSVSRTIRELFTGENEMIFEQEVILNEEPENLSALMRVPFQGITQAYAVITERFSAFINTLDEWIDADFEANDADDLTPDFKDALIISEFEIAIADVEKQWADRIEPGAKHLAAEKAAEDEELEPAIKNHERKLKRLAPEVEHCYRMYLMYEEIDFSEIAALASELSDDEEEQARGGAMGEENGEMPEGHPPADTNSPISFPQAV
jgi:hypothetical protein